jgi:hypothetical protein
MAVGFKSQRALVQHLNLADDASPYKCDDCDQPFDRLSAHILTHPSTSWSVVVPRASTLHISTSTLERMSSNVMSAGDHSTY